MSSVLSSQARFLPARRDIQITTLHYRRAGPAGGNIICLEYIFSRGLLGLLQPKVDWNAEWYL